MKPTTLMKTALLGIGVFACATDNDPPVPDPVDPAARFLGGGAHAVGYRVMEAVRTDAPPLVVKGWYPADVSNKEAPAIEYEVRSKWVGFPPGPLAISGSAHRDAAPSDKGVRFPLVVLSHGFAVSPEWYHTLPEHLASHGFVVLAPEHDESDWATDVVRASVARPRDASDTIDFAGSGPLRAIVDLEHIGVVGHSYGGYTSLALGGARFDTKALAARCVDADPATAGMFCQPFLDGEQELAALMGLAEAPDGRWPALADPRVDAIVSMAGDAYLFGEDGLASVTTPAMFIGGTADTGTPWNWGDGLAFDSVSSTTRMLVAFEGAEHFIQVSSCDDMPWTQELPPDFRGYVCEDPAWNKRDALRIINQFTSAFFALTLRADDEGREALAPEQHANTVGLDITDVP